MWLEKVLEEWQNSFLNGSQSETVAVAVQANFRVAVFWEVVWQ